jgi:hypothetical protein
MEEYNVLEANVNIKGPKEACDIIKLTVEAFIKTMHTLGLVEFIQEIRIAKMLKSLVIKLLLSVNFLMILQIL